MKTAANRWPSADPGTETQPIAEKEGAAGRDIDGIGEPREAAIGERRVDMDLERRNHPSQPAIPFLQPVADTDVIEQQRAVA